MQQHLKDMRWYCVGFIPLLLILTGCTSTQPIVPGQQIWTATQSTQPPSIQTGATVEEPTIFSSGVTFPIDRALERVTKKTFWLRVSRDDSPVSPERFTRYHTGVDFETFPEEQDTDISIRAICTGPILLKKWATGYGGVVVEQCQIENRDVTVIYGHLDIDSISVSVGSIVQAGSEIWVLGRGYSTETDGERKHLHLSIHEWTSVNIKGYVASSSELNQWIDPMRYLK